MYLVRVLRMYRYVQGSPGFLDITTVRRSIRLALHQQAKQERFLFKRGASPAGIIGHVKVAIIHSIRQCLDLLNLDVDPPSTPSAGTVLGS